MKGLIIAFIVGLLTGLAFITYLELLPYMNISS